ncbi:MAG: hypothetical protein DRI36_05505, partial [Caldiserica bacterium]
MGISFIISCLNFTDITEKLIKFLLKYMKDEDEIILVKDGEPLQNLVPSFNLRIINLNRVYGPSFARNVGAKNSLNEILVFIDSDVILKNNFINKLRKIGEGEIWQGVYSFDRKGNVYELSRAVFKEYSLSKVKEPIG